MFDVIDRQILERDIARTRATGAELHFTPIRVLDSMLETIREQEAKIAELEAAKEENARLRASCEQALGLVYPRGEVGKVLTAALGKEA